MGYTTSNPKESTLSRLNRQSDSVSVKIIERTVEKNNEILKKARVVIEENRKFLSEKKIDAFDFLIQA